MNRQPLDLLVVDMRNGRHRLNADERQLSSYLNDHLFIASLAANLAHRVGRVKTKPDIAWAISVMEHDLVCDRETLASMICTIGTRPRRGTQFAAHTTEFLGRLKPNGSVLHRSATTSLLEVESLRMLVAGNLCAWKALRDLSETDARIDRSVAELMATRSQDQLETLSALHAALSEELSADAHFTPGLVHTGNSPHRGMMDTVEPPAITRE